MRIRGCTGGIAVPGIVRIAEVPLQFSPWVGDRRGCLGVRRGLARASVRRDLGGRLCAADERRGVD